MGAYKALAKVKRQTVCCRIVKSYIFCDPIGLECIFWTCEIGGAVCRTDVIEEDDVDVMLRHLLFFEVIYGIGYKTAAGEDK